MNNMRRKLTGLALAFVFLCALFGTLYGYLKLDWALSVSITFGTISYHFLMRLLVGLIFNTIMSNQADYTKKWYCVHNFEIRIYKKLKVKKWKGKMPTFDTSLFDRNLHTWSEILSAMCQAELVHEVCAILSLVPILAGKWFGVYPVFIITSIFAGLFELSFVMIQRYNRQRIIRLMKKSEKTRKKYEQ